MLLVPDKRQNVCDVICIEQKYTDSPYSKPLHTDMTTTVIDSIEMQQDGTDLLWIVGPVCGAVVLILLVVLIIIFMR